MKKSLWYSLVFAVTVTAFTGCMKKDAYEPDRPEQDAQQLYKTNFEAYVGGTINSSVDWGFGRTARARALTRAQLDSVKLDSTGYSTDFSDKYFQTVKEYFGEGQVCKSKDWWNYEFVQNGKFFNVRMIYAHTDQNDSIGFYYYDPATETYESPFITISKITMVIWAIICSSTERIQEETGSLSVPHKAILFGKEPALPREYVPGPLPFI